MKRRSRRSLAAGLVAVALVALCAFAVAVSIQVLMDPRRLDDVTRTVGVLNTVRWGDITVVAVAAGVGLIGLVLVLAAIVPGRLIIVPLADDDTAISAGVGRRSLSSALRRGVLAVDGVSAVSLKRRRRKIVAVVRTSRGTTDGLADAGRAAVDGVLDHIELGARPTVAVKVKTLRSSS